MSFIDPGGIFGAQGDLLLPADKRTGASMTQTLFGGGSPSTTANSASLSSPSEASTSDRQQYQDGGSPREERTASLVDEPYGGLVAPPLDPPAAFPAAYDVCVIGIPEAGARSRTETQVKLILRVLPRAGQPVCKSLILPSHQLSCTQRAKFFEDQLFIDHGSNALHLRARVVRSDADETLYACYSCILRERKRALRKRAKEDPSDELLSLDVSAAKETEQDRERILIFASQVDKLQVLKGDAMLPVRLTCYCRHHEERTGFRVKIELLDNCYRLVGSAYSPPILITDDHKRVPRHARSETAMPVTMQMQMQMQMPSRPVSPTAVPYDFMDLDCMQVAEPRVLKVVPAEGPMHGGIEITVLGEHLCAQSVVMFGPLPSKVVNFVSPTTVVVRLPPSQVAGIVQVYIDGPNPVPPQQPEDYAIFNYKNDLDRAMMELALQLIGMKMTGRVDDARDIAMRIITEFSPSGAGVAESTLPTQQHAVSSSLSTSPHLEGVLITCLAAAEATGGLGFSDDDVARFRTRGGQTLLHLAALARYDHLFEYLGGLGEGLLLATVDKNGFTPADLYYLAGRQDFLETLGLDDSDHEGELTELDVLQRYRLIQRRAAQRTERPAGSAWAVISAGLARIRRRPSLMRNHLNRLRNAIWWKLTSEATIKEYYLQTFGAKSMALDAGQRIYKSYQESKPSRRRSRDLMFVYFWLPVVLAALLVWYFDLGSNLVLSTATLWPEQPAAAVAR